MKDRFKPLSPQDLGQLARTSAELEVLIAGSGNTSLQTGVSSKYIVPAYEVVHQARQDIMTALGLGIIDIGTAIDIFHPPITTSIERAIASDLPFNQVQAIIALVNTPPGK